MRSHKTTAVVVTYNSAGHVTSCLEAALRYCARVIVVDNASRDGTREEVRQLPAVQLIANAGNRGFAAAANLGFTLAGTEYVLLLNPDCILQGPVGALESACADLDAAVACGLLADPDGRPQAGFSVRRLPLASTLAFEVLGLNRALPANPVNKRYRCLDLDLSQRRLVEQPAGAFLLVRRDVWRALGGFDEEFYPLWFEDVDFARRLAARRARIVLEPSVRALHSGGHSLASLSPAKRQKYWYDNLLRYAAKHFSSIQFRIVCGAVAVGAAALMVTGIVTFGRNTPVAAFGKVAAKAMVRFLTGPSRRRTLPAAGEARPGMHPAEG